MTKLFDFINNIKRISIQKRFLLFLFCASLLVRGIFFCAVLAKDNNYWNYDTDLYHNVAVQIANGNGIKDIDGTNHFHRVPGYSLFLSASYKIFNDTDTKKAMWLQIFLSSFIPILIFLLSLVLFPADLLLAKIVSIFSVFHLGYVLFAGLALTDSLFALFFLLFCILFYKNLHLFFCKDSSCKNSFYKNSFYKIDLKKIFFAGIFLGIASMLRPVGHNIIIVAVFLLFISKNNFINKIKSSFLFFMGWFSIVFLWLLRNWLLTGFIFFHALPGIHFLKHSAARVGMDVYNCSYTQSLSILNKECDALNHKEEVGFGRKLNAIENCKIMEKVSLKYFLNYPAITIKHFLINIFKTCFALYSAELLFIDSGGKLPPYENDRSCKSILSRFLFPDVSNKFFLFLIYMEILFFFLIWVGFVGFVFNIFFNQELLCIFLKTGAICGLMIFLSIACGFARLRLPIESFLIILSFKFWLNLLKKEKRVLWANN